MTLQRFLLGAGLVAFLASQKPCPLRLEQLFLSRHEPSAGTGLTQDLGSSALSPMAVQKSEYRPGTLERLSGVPGPGAFFRPHGLGREGDSDVKVCSYETPQRSGSTKASAFQPQQCVLGPPPQNGPAGSLLPRAQ